MSINIGPPSVDELKPKIAVIGVGGAGGNAIANMIGANVEGVDFIVANTDAQSLNSSVAEHRIQLGPDITQGLGAGSRPEVGRAAAEETLDQVKAALDGAHMCFIAAGMGGGTGTGAAPVIAQAAREMNILTVGVVTKPFTFEGTRRMRSADAGIEELQKNVDTLIVIPNQNLFLVANPNTTFKEAFLLADEVLQQGVRGITDLMVMPGLINLDFADVRSVMHEMGKAMMGTGEAEGDGRALEAAEKAISNPLLDGVSMKGAKGVIVSITGGEDMRLMEVDEAANHIRELVDPDANIIWGSAFNESLEGKIRVSVVATGIDTDSYTEGEQPSRSFAFPASRPAAPKREEPVSDEPVSQEPVAAPDEQSAQQPVADIPQPTKSQVDDNEPLDLSAADAAPESAEAEAPANEPDVSQPRFQRKPMFGGKDQARTDADANTGADTDTLELSGGTAPAREEAKEAKSAPSLKPGAAATEEKPAKAAPRIASGGGTLFERMSNLSRGLGKEDADSESDDEDNDPLNIPRFLGRQNNQR